MEQSIRNATQQPNSEPEDIIDYDDGSRLPKYCNFHKFFLVEELALEADYRELHHGKCVVIGRLSENVDGSFELENIRLPHIARQYSLPEGALRLRLFVFQNTSSVFEVGRFCELYGEVVLRHLHNPKLNRIPLTARGVHERLARLPDSERTQRLAELQRDYQPAIRVLHLRYVERASELAERNLELRLLNSRRTNC